MIRQTLILFYNFNRVAMNFYWMMYIKYLWTGNITLFGHIMGVITILYGVSNFVYYFMPEKQPERR